MGSYIEGWQAGALAVGVAALGLLLAVPRAVEPVELPLPEISPSALREASARENARAGRLAARIASGATAETYDVRLAGDLLRQIGLADREKDRDRIASLRDRLAKTLLDVRKGAGEEALAELRAYQERSFLRELALWEATGEESEELTAVSGDFLGLAKRSGWTAAPHRLVCDEAVRGALFRRRFGELTALREGRFALTTDEQRHLLGFFLAHPPPGGAGPAIDDPAQRDTATAVWLLRKVDELGSLDPVYPVAFARGVLLYRAGDPAASALAFRAHLAAHPDGPWTLRARNHLRAAEARIDVAP